MGRFLNLANGAGQNLEKLGVFPRKVKTDALINAARKIDSKRQAGSPELEPAVRMLCKACDEEADLTFVGRMAARRQIEELFENYERMEDAVARHPEIKDEQIKRPIFITGLPRTGSTLLHSLLAQDPEVRTPSHWEVMRPPVSRGDQSSAVRYCEKRLDWAHRLAPAFRTIHPMGAHLPQECIAITAYVFQSIVFHTTQYVPTYEDWFEQSDQEFAYRFHKQFLQLLQYFGHSGRWILKAPGHMFGIRDLLKVYPDAVIVHTHRDPLRVAPSLVSHTKVLREAFSHRADAHEVAEDWLERWWRGNDLMLDVRGEQPDVFLDVLYSDLVRDPIVAIQTLYEQLGWTLSSDAEKRMRDFLAENPKNKHGAHRYSLEMCGIDKAALQKRVERYCSMFPIQEEPI